MQKHLPFIVAIIFFVISLNVANAMFGPAKCRDGWASPSIGKQGACSSHGGVGGDPGPTTAIIFGVFGWFLGKRISTGGRVLPNGTLPFRPSTVVAKEPDSEAKPKEKAESKLTEEEKLYANYQGKGGTLDIDKWRDARKWMDDTDWSKPQ
jgi:hypothetical protein